MLEPIVYMAMVISGIISAFMLCMLALGELAIAFGAHVPGHRKLGKLFMWVVGFTFITIVSLIIIKSLGL